MYLYPLFAACPAAPHPHPRHFAMRLPTYAPWDPSFGPYLMPQGPRARLAEAWLQQLKEDCGWVRVWVRCGRGCHSPGLSSVRPGHGNKVNVTAQDGLGKGENSPT